MRAAAERHLTSWGDGRSGPPNELRLENGVTGMAMRISDFAKLGCEEARGRPGYACDYSITLDTRLYALDGSDHARPADGPVEISPRDGAWRSIKKNASARFVLTGSDWQLVRD